MLGGLVVFAAFRFNFAQTDYSCTQIDSTGALILSQSATRGCTDTMPTAECAYYFSVARNAPAAAAGAPAMTGRAETCFQDATSFNAELKRAAIAMCPLYCGYCCLTPAVNCSNSPAPRVDCGSITDDMCVSPLWREIIAEDCPSSCGFCLLGGCVDAAPDCATQPTICSNVALSSFTQTNCQRTCGLCGNGTTVGCVSRTTTISATATSPSRSCIDQSSACPLWNRNGFCGSQFYTTEHKMSYCRATCALC